MYTVSEVAELLNLTERAIRERIKQGTIDAEKNGKSWQIPSAQFRTTSKEPDETQSALDILQSENEFLNRQITEKDRQLQDSNEARERSDQIIFKLSTQIEKQQLQLEDLSKPKTIWGKLSAIFGSS